MFYETDPSVRRALDEHHRAYLANEFRAAQTMFGRLNVQALIQYVPNFFAVKRLRLRVGKPLSNQRQVPT